MPYLLPEPSGMHILMRLKRGELFGLGSSGSFGLRTHRADPSVWSAKCPNQSQLLEEGGGQ